MRKRSAIAAIAFLSAVVPALGHQVDEYLQATTIVVEKGRLALQLRLTPGVEVARKALAGIDTDGDGTISDGEQRAYAQQVGRDLSVAMDGRSLPLRLVSSSFPDVEGLTKGLGSILLEFEAEAPRGGPEHRLTLENHHRGDIASFLVNGLRPRDPGVHIIAQHRNYSQSSYRLDYALDDAPPAPRGIPSAPWQEQDRSGALAVMETYFCHGVHHILTGYDHLLFVSILVLAAKTLWDLVKVVTAFTLAHSITLTLVALNLVHLPGWIVEPMIAASIVFVALQNLFWPESSRGCGRLAAAFFFGLFHGMGFAGGLLDVMRGLPRETAVLAILGFSVGVEAGHQVVLLPLYGFLRAARQLRRDDAERAKLSMMLQRFGSAGVLVAGVYYVLSIITYNL
jgi:hydrogenase/urease accessory protein HupE